MDLIALNIDHVTLPPWSLKRKKSIEIHRIRNSVINNGQIQPVHVRYLQTLPNENAKFEIIDGRTVHAALKEMNEPTIWAINHGKISIEDAKKLYLTLEFTNKTPDPLVLAEMIYIMSKEQSIKTLQNQLPFDKDQIEYYVELCNFDWRQHVAKPKDEQQIGLF